MQTSRFSRITGFVDEASDDPKVQLSLAKDLGLKAVDVRGFSGKNVMQLTDDETENYRQLAASEGLEIETVSSPINKVALTPENRTAEMAKLRRAIELCDVLGTRRIRIFSPEVNETCDASDWPAVKEWMADQVAMAAEAGVVLLHENDARFYGAFPDGSKRLLGEFGGPNFKAVFDFANATLIGQRPFDDWFPWIYPHLDCLHIKDAVQATHQIVPAGHGDGQMRETFAWLAKKGWDGSLTVEPHLAAAGPFGGFSGVELFTAAVNALKELASEFQN